MVKEIKQTEEQLNIVNSSADIKRIIACAGSGKTMVLTGNIIKVIRDRVCSPDKILALTFTRNAAENMRVRIKESIGRDVDLEGLSIFTFNSFGNEIIREHSFEFGLGKNFTIINNSQSWQILYEIFNESSFKYLKTGKRTGEFIQGLLNYIESLKNNLISVSEFGDYLNNYKKILSEYKSKALRNEEEKLIDSRKELFDVYMEYERRKIKSNCIDYPDQVFMPYFLLKGKKSIKARYRQRYKYIFVDEFQDTNIAQSHLLSMLFSPGENKIVVVGDDDQGIYSFRGASVENILNFHKFEGFRNCRVYDFFLTTNFRSGTDIINTINSIISSNNNRFKKQLKPSDSQKESEVVFCYKKTHEEEAAEIAGIIKHLAAGGIKLKHMAILARKKKFEKIIRELEAGNIKFELVGGKNFFFEPEILFIVSWLKVIENTDDEISIACLLKSEKYKICDRDLFFIKRNYRSLNEKINLIDGIMESRENPYLSSETKKRLEEFLLCLRLYISKSRELELKELISLIVEHSGMLNELKSGFGPAAGRKIKNIENLIRVAADFQQTYLEDNPASFLTFLKDVAKTDYDDPETVEFSGENSVKIMSIHAAKGLEFDVVFLPMLWKRDYSARKLSRGLTIPAELRKDNSIYKEKKNFTGAAGFNRALKDIRTEEERRIFYVGCSRAKRILVLSYSEYGEKTEEIVPFFDDIANNGNLKITDKEGLDFLRKLYPEKSFKGPEDYKNIFNFSGPDKKAVKGIKAGSDYRWDSYQKILAEKILKSGAGGREDEMLRKIMKKISSGPVCSSPEDNLKERNFFPLTWILDYKKCPLLYRWKHVYFIPEKSRRETGRGEEIHGYLKNITLAGFKNRLLKEEILKRFDNMETGKYIKTFLDSKLWDFSGVKSVRAEQLFYWKVKDYYITGRFDRVDFKKDNRLNIFDYKVSKYSKNKNVKRAGFQMKTYMAALSEIYKKPVEDITGYLFYLKDGVIKTVNLKKDEARQLKESILCDIKKIRAADFKCDFKEECKKICSYYGFCQGN